MEGALNERQRMNLPAGMSELDLLVYSPTLYELYRNEGNGMDKDGFRFDPVVASGMLASDINYGSNMAWVNYMTPESLASLNPGDNLIVPVNSFDNYKQLPPWEKRLSHEVSYTGNKQNSKKNSRMNSNSHFTGDFNNYFDHESRALGAMTDSALPSTSPVGPAMDVTLNPAGSTTPPPTRGNTAPASLVSSPLPPPMEAILNPTPTSTPRSADTPSISAPRSVVTNPSPVVNKPSDMSCSALMSTYGIVPGLSWGNATQDVIDAWNSKDCSGQFTIPRPMSPAAIALNPVDTNTGLFYNIDPNTGMVADTGTVTTPADTYSGMGGGGGGASSEMPADEQPADGSGAKDAASVISMKSECKLNYIPIIIGAILGLIISYYIAKKKEKDVKSFGIIGLIIGAILGFAYAKHQCKPIAALSKIGIPSKSLKTTSSNYYGGR